MKRTRGIARRAAKRLLAARIVIVTEGKSTEPAYLRLFDRIYGNSLSVRLAVIPAAGDPRSVVERAIEEDSKLRRDKLSSNDTVWAMFDRDAHMRFDEAIDMARGNHILLAVSDPCFELWGIFHYRDYHAPIDRHECQRLLASLCEGYNTLKGKLFDDPEIINKRYFNAVERAKNSLVRRAEEQRPRGNPSTTVHLLTERIRHAANHRK